jgi:hypothetical protein
MFSFVTAFTFEPIGVIVYGYLESTWSSVYADNDGDDAWKNTKEAVAVALYSLQLTRVAVVVDPEDSVGEVEERFANLVMLEEDMDELPQNWR